MEGRESPLFLSYFKETGLEILPGGVASGFNKARTNHGGRPVLHAHTHTHTHT